MTDRDRLIELIDNVLKYLPWGEVGVHTNEELADYLLANGVIVPPYEVGTKVYVIASQTSDNRNFYIFEDIITHYHIGGGCVVMGFDNHLGVYSWNWDKVFLTKEEAEKALKELNKNA